ncbi:MAG TPA: Ku protein [Acidobacteriaceae bacterium]
MSRPFWSGQIKISLVSFGIELFPATNPSSGVTFHQIDRKTGQRIHHVNVAEDEEEPLNNSEIVKGYEYSKGKYLVLEPDEIAKLRIETKNTIDVKQFVSAGELPPALFERPYFVMPAPKESTDAFAVVRKAMEETGKAAIGEIAFGGREHLVAITAPPEKSSPGLMAYMLRYGEELRHSSDYLSDDAKPHSATIDKKQLAMATQLIEAYSRPFNLDDYKDDYEEALRELIRAKQKNIPLPLDEERAGPAKVVNLMDALRRSVSQTSSRRAAPAKRRTKAPPEKGPVLVGAKRRKHRAA